MPDEIFTNTLFLLLLKVRQNLNKIRLLLTEKKLKLLV